MFSSSSTWKSFIFDGIAISSKDQGFLSLLAEKVSWLEQESWKWKNLCQKTVLLIRLQTLCLYFEKLRWLIFRSVINFFEKYLIIIGEKKNILAQLAPLEKQVFLWFKSTYLLCIWRKWVKIVSEHKTAFHKTEQTDHWLEIRMVYFRNFY